MDLLFSLGFFTVLQIFKSNWKYVDPRSSFDQRWCHTTFIIFWNKGNYREVWTLRRKCVKLSCTIIQKAHWVIARVFPCVKKFGAILVLKKHR